MILGVKFRKLIFFIISLIIFLMSECSIADDYLTHIRIANPTTHTLSAKFKLDPDSESFYHWNGTCKINPNDMSHGCNHAIQSFGEDSWESTLQVSAKDELGRTMVTFHNIYFSNDNMSFDDAKQRHFDNGLHMALSGSRRIKNRYQITIDDNERANVAYQTLKLQGFEVGLFNSSTTGTKLCDTQQDQFGSYYCVDWDTIYRFNADLPFNYTGSQGRIDSLGQFEVQYSADNQNWTTIGNVVEPLVAPKDSDGYYHVYPEFYLKIHENKTTSGATSSTTSNYCSNTDSSSCKPIQYVRLCQTKSNSCTNAVDLSTIAEIDPGKLPNNNFNVDATAQLTVAYNGLNQETIVLDKTKEKKQGQNQLKLALPSWMYQHAYFIDENNKIIDNIHHANTEPNFSDHRFEVMSTPGAFVFNDNQAYFPDIPAFDSQQYYFSSDNTAYDLNYSVTPNISLCTNQMALNNTAESDGSGIINDGNDYNCFSQATKLSVNQRGGYSLGFSPQSPSSSLTLINLNDSSPQTIFNWDQFETQASLFVSNYQATINWGSSMHKHSHPTNSFSYGNVSLAYHFPATHTESDDYFVYAVEPWYGSTYELKSNTFHSSKSSKDLKTLFSENGITLDLFDMYGTRCLAIYDTKSKTLSCDSSVN